MDVVLRLLSFPSIFVGFGEGVYRGQQVRPYGKLEDPVKDRRNAKDSSCHVPSSTALALKLDW